MRTSTTEYSHTHSTFVPAHIYAHGDYFRGLLRARCLHVLCEPVYRTARAMRRSTHCTCTLFCARAGHSVRRSTTVLAVHVKTSVHAMHMRIWPNGNAGGGGGEELCLYLVVTIATTYIVPVHVQVYVRCTRITHCLLLCVHCIGHEYHAFLNVCTPEAMFLVSEGVEMRNRKYFSSVDIFQ